MWNALEGMVRRYVPSKHGVYDSVCVEEVNEAFRALAVEGWFVIIDEDRGRLKGRFVTDRHRSGVGVSGKPGVRPAKMLVPPKVGDRQ